LRSFGSMAMNPQIPQEQELFFFTSWTIAVREDCRSIVHLNIPVCPQNPEQVFRLTSTYCSQATFSLWHLEYAASYNQ
jgi:hypothetical protein